MEVKDDHFLVLVNHNVQCCQSVPYFCDSGTICKYPDL